MRTFATLTLPDGVYACTAQPDGTIPLSSRCMGRNDQHADKAGVGLRALVEQANLAAELAECLRALVGANNNRPDPRLYDRARAALARAGELQ
jgi:hypothetical protein